MACTTDHEEWTFHMFNDRTGTDDILIFCFMFVNGVLTGTVSDKDGKPLSTDTSVKGIRVGIGNLGEHIETAATVTDVVSFSFRWDEGSNPIRVSISGFIFDDGLLKFAGRFRANADAMQLADSSRLLLLGPADGDTGTGTGSQT